MHVDNSFAANASPWRETCWATENAHARFKFALLVKKALAADEHHIVAGILLGLVAIVRSVGIASVVALAFGHRHLDGNNPHWLFEVPNWCEFMRKRQSNHEQIQNTLAVDSLPTAHRLSVLTTDTEPIELA